MIKRTVGAIHKLRVYLLLIITFSFLYLAGVNPVKVSFFIGAHISRAVGMDVSVPENPFNKLALQLKEKEQLLNLREADLNKREASTADNRNDLYLAILGGGVILLFLLVMINYYLDYKRRKTGR
jgi:hypothetical protein